MYLHKIYVYVLMTTALAISYWTRTITWCPGTSARIVFPQSLSRSTRIRDLALYRNNDRSVPIPSLVAVWESRNGNNKRPCVLYMYMYMYYELMYFQVVELYIDYFWLLQ